MSLAIWRYRNVMARDGGPIATLKIESVELVDGANAFQAYAWLDERSIIVPERYKDHQIYGSSHGTGTDPTAIRAGHKAISEALERWAFFATCDSGKHGYDVNKSTTGMAAFPGLTTARARRLALAEAAERWALGAWWRGELAFSTRTGWPAKGLNAVVVPLGGLHQTLVIVFGDRSDRPNVYGFGAGADERQAAVAAIKEFSRNAYVLAAAETNPEAIDKASLNIHERRLQYFSTAAGRERFEQALAREGASSLESAPRLLVDEEVRGPWTKYATVWRCLFGSPRQEGPNHEVEVFLF
jgi:hypothetical protein